MEISNYPIKEANNLTQLWQKYGPNTYPLDIDELINGALHSSGFQGELLVKKDCFESFEGCLVRTKDTDRWTILLNDRVQNNRRLRFTQAHELGHFMCHREFQDRFEDSLETLNNFGQKFEREANVFASWLLLPANVIRSEFGGVGWNIDTLCELGSRFECSLQASALRFVLWSSKSIAFVVSRDGMINWSCKSKSAPYLRSYKSGDELPNLSNANACFNTGERSKKAVETGHAWSNIVRSRESQYFDSSGCGYQYTCIEFES